MSRARTEAAPMERGDYDSQDLSHKLGEEYLFPDIDMTTSSSGVRSKRSTVFNVVRLVKNSSGIALLPKRVVKFKAGTNGTEVDGYVRTPQDRGAGVVDEWLPAAGVPDGAYFYILREGTGLGLTSLEAADTTAIAQGDTLVGQTAATSQATTAGRLTPPVYTAATTGNVPASVQTGLAVFGVAQSAKTSGNTNSDVLASWDFTRFDG